MTSCLKIEKYISLIDHQAFTAPAAAAAAPVVPAVAGEAAAGGIGSSGAILRSGS